MLENSGISLIDYWEITVQESYTQPRYHLSNQPMERQISPNSGDQRVYHFILSEKYTQMGVLTKGKIKEELNISRRKNDT